MRRSSGGFLVFIIIGLLLGAGRKCAGEDSFYRELAIQGFAASVDLGSTEWALRHNPRLSEGNPLGATFERRLLLKSIEVVSIAAIVTHLERGGHPKWARFMRWAGVVAQVAAGAWNVRQGLRAP